MPYTHDSVNFPLNQKMLIKNQFIYWRVSNILVKYIQSVMCICEIAHLPNISSEYFM